MDLILCHQTADFDALGAAVGLSLLKAGSRIVLTGGAHPTVREFLALHRDEFALIEMRSVNPARIRSLIIVDNQWRERLGKASQWLDLDHLQAIELYDHHLDSESDIHASSVHLEGVGATTTLIVEALQKAQIKPNSMAATVMALGIHVDTGSLTFAGSTPRDAYALAWLMTCGANIKTIAQYCQPSFSPRLQELFSLAWENLEIKTIHGRKIAHVLLHTADFIPGLSSVAERLLELSDSDALLFGHSYSKDEEDNSRQRLTVIGRSRIDGVNLYQLFSPYNGGGHAQAASVSFRDVQPAPQLNQLLGDLIAQIPPSPTARDLMSSPVRTIRPDTSISQAERILFRYGHSGLSVVDEQDRLVGVISRRDLDLALHHGFSHAPVKGYMTCNPKTITPDTSLQEIESLMVTYDLGRLPVLENGQLVGIVTRTDVLRQIHQNERVRFEGVALVSCLLPAIKERLEPILWSFLQAAATAAQQRGWHLYLVGGAVRDLLLATERDTLLLQDIDLVVDGCHRAASVGAGVELANCLQEIYPGARLSIHGEFQTAALLWHKDERFGSLWVDIATARTEFYPYPASNPQVEASSIRQDLYRRDFTINALAIRLTSPKEGELLDFFGGTLDLRAQQIRVLHANSFIEDPTRIYRAVRFATRLGFVIEPLTESYIRYAIESGVYERSRQQNQNAPALQSRLKAELNYILEADYWEIALEKLAELGALHCLHGDLSLNRALWRQLRCLSRWLDCLSLELPVNAWLMRLELLIASLAVGERIAIANNLQLPKDSLGRLQKLEVMEKEISNNFAYDRPISQIVSFFKGYQVPSLLLVAVRSQTRMRALIWQYLTKWSQIEAPIDGNDLKALGYQPGPGFKSLLAAVLGATLDGIVSNKSEARAFIARLTKSAD
ncbi:CCA-adding enzyme [Microcystis aeruginosa NIES-1211]|uniref:CCA-adding enzyme n=1 Tax=Microcystis aeruginosa NIES-2519 TaxID=2303981 RepID=A0A5A5RA71_MICAE|nr:CBS domain-containing protein [Microcystis aeruginosa]GBL15127.1 CCA-adding enzyme [Microcystis aeruginosa NIES-1211]GCA72900.1 CCA-adding enzyme [Microcystis aeruginosa NIES-2519]